MPRHELGGGYLLRIDQLIFSDLVISAYGLSKSPSPFAAAPAWASFATLAFLVRDRFPGLELVDPLAGVEARDDGTSEGGPWLVNLILVMGFFTDGGCGGGGGVPLRKAGAALKVCRNGPAGVGTGWEPFSTVIGPVTKLL